jgi:hypothetical protein
MFFEKYVEKVAWALKFRAFWDVAPCILVGVD